MSYIGRTPTIGNFQICDAISVVNGQAAYTMQVASVNVSPESANHMIVSLNGVIQKANSSFTVSGSTITFSSNLVTGDVINFIQILGNVLDFGVPSDATVTTAKIADDAVTTDKLANSINSAITANTAKVTNATHSGDVTGATALTIADNAVTLAKMASGTDGNLITYDASGNPAAVATGSSGQVLTSAGAGAPPTFATLSAESNTPSFYAFGDGATSIPNATLQTISVQNERFDSGGCYNATSSTATLNSISVPAYRFAPNVGGLYYFIGAVRITGTGSGSWNLGLVNNLGGTGGSETYASLRYHSANDNNTLMVQGFSVMNGSGNNMVLTAYQESGGTLNSSDAIYTTYFGGFLVKKS
jgi:hypothetical protein